MSSPSASAEPRRPKPRAILRLLLDHFRPFRRRLAGITLFATVGAGFEAAVVFMIAGLGSMLMNGDMAVERDMFGVEVTLSRTVLCVMALGAVLIRSGIDLALVWLKSRTNALYDADARSRLLTGFLESNWELQSEERAGGLQAALGTYVGQARTALQRTSEFVTGFVSFIVLMASSIVAGGLAAIVVVVAMALVAIILRPLIESNHRAARTYRSTANSFSDKTEQIVRMAREVRVFGATDAVERETTQESRQVGESIGAMESASGRLSSLSMSITYLAAVGGLIALITLDVDSPQRYVAMVLLLYRAMIYGRSLQGSYQGLVSATPFVEALDERLERYAAAREVFGTAEIDGPIESISFDDVTFAYPSGVKALDSVSFTIKRGEAIGLVGPSGSGKSTLIQLLLGFRAPTDGRVTVDGRPPSDYARDSWSQHITLVPQESLLFDTTVLDNLICYRPDVSDEDVHAAVADAHMRQDIDRLPQGLATNVGEGGRRLSGGQRQRLCLARSLAGHPDVLVLDEPTSALDLVSEEAIRQTLESLKGNVTLVIIAHRMSTLRLCDRVLVLNNGQLEASGSREDLERDNQYYAQAIELSKLT